MQRDHGRTTMAKHPSKTFESVAKHPPEKRRQRQNFHQDGDGKASVREAYKLSARENGATYMVKVRT